MTAATLVAHGTPAGTDGHAEHNGAGPRANGSSPSRRPSWCGRAPPGPGHCRRRAARGAIRSLLVQLLSMSPRIVGGRRATVTVTALLTLSVVAACAPGADRAVEAAPASAPAAAPSPITPSPETSLPPSLAASPILAASLAPSSSPTATPSATPIAAPSPAASAPRELKEFALNLYRPGDFVGQYTFEWCVGASIQMAWNMVESAERSSRADQKRLWEQARDRSFSPFGGANPRGWTAILNELGIGPYRLVSIPTYDEALRVAARALRETRRPVGLVMWRGRHAWVMSGFESVGDPRIHAEFRVTGVRVLDPLYPHGSSVWGPSPKPNSLVSPKRLAEQFVFRDSRRVNLGVPPGYLLIVPEGA